MIFYSSFPSSASSRHDEQKMRLYLTSIMFYRFLAWLLEVLHISIRSRPDTSLDSPNPEAAVPATVIGSSLRKSEASTKTVGRYKPPQRRGQQGKLAGPCSGHAPLHSKASSSIQRGQRSAAQDGKKSVTRSEWLLKNTRHLMMTVNPARLEAGSTAVGSHAGFELLCSYNWMTTRDSSIYVPGMLIQYQENTPTKQRSVPKIVGGPPLWTPKSLPVTVPQTVGLEFPNQNSYKEPSYPFEPMYQALNIMSPAFDFASVDLVTNRNSLLQLFEFASGSARKSYRIDLHMVQNTLFLTRREQKTHHMVHAFGNTKIGSNFEGTFTTPEPGLEDSCSHHRVVRYALGNLSCVVRFEVDACYERNQDTQDSESGNIDTSRGENEDKIASSKQRLLVETEAKKTPRYRSTSVVSGGRIAPSPAIAEIKTRCNEDFDIKLMLPQLWFGRTSHLFVGTHKNGTFHKVEEFDAAAQLLEWEIQHQGTLRKMVRLIADLRETALRAPNGHCALVVTRWPLTAAVYAGPTNNSVLPYHIIHQFWHEGGTPQD